MKKKNPIMFWLCIGAVIIFIICMVRHFHVKNFNVVKDEVLYTSGQPRGMDYTRLLYKYHIATFINLRSADEHREKNWYNEEVTWMRTNGANYIELPMAKNVFPDEAACRKFLAIMADTANLPVLVHDSSGRKRVSFLTAVWMLKDGGFTLAEARSKAEELNSEKLDDKELNFLKSLQE